MFLFVRACVFDEEWTRSFEFRCEHRIDRNVAERRTPSSFARNRHIRTTRKMPYAKNNDATRNMNLREDGASYMSGIDVAGMRHQTSFNMRLLLRIWLIREPADKCREFLWIGGIKLACNGGKAKHRRSAELDWLGSLAFNFDRFICRWVVENGHFVAVLVAALINKLLHL